ncbi:MAG: RDD family protein [Halobacteriovoraceae bacterium]|nr:RDD family protein [Halobacteriovoraceae bacterium]MBT5095001.1 RDD family protein [Halobacteriovoraceae bacterium]
MGDKKDDDWSFDLDRNEKKQVKQDSGGDNEDLFKQDSKRLKVDGKSVKRKESRSKLARRQAELDNQKDIAPGSMGKRLIAYIIDGALVAISAAVLTIFLKDKAIQLYTEQVRELGMNQNIGPTDLEKLMGSIFLLGSFLILQVFYSAVKKRSIGKVLTGLWVLDSAKEHNAGFVKMFLRELLVKPLSLLFFVGFIIPFINADKRSLHDFISGTFVADE